jgi:hypothetical protein
MSSEQQDKALQLRQQSIPKISDLYDDKEMVAKTNMLNMLVNQPPKAEWLKEHPMVKGLKYIPIQRIEWLLTSIFVKWWVEILSTQLIANSVVVTVRVFYKDPLSDEILHQDGIGAAPLQTDKGAGATDFNAVKSSSVQIAAPAAESYGIKDACEKIGKLFGKDISRADEISYSLNTQMPEKITKEDLQELYDLKYESLTESEKNDAERILKNQEVNSYSKLQKLLISK